MKKQICAFLKIRAVLGIKHWQFLSSKSEIIDKQILTLPSEMHLGRSNKYSGDDSILQIRVDLCVY